jgi:Fur family zinc uptake transcriptional regulator
MIYPISFIDYCASLSYRFTSLRKHVLFILWQFNKPLKAYDVLEHLNRSNKKSQPSTVYRVLDYFVSCGIVHKIESIQSYILCGEPKKKLASEILMVCYHCHDIQEVYNKQLCLLVENISTEYQFNLGQDIIELKGYCQRCQIISPK